MRAACTGQKTLQTRSTAYTNGRLEEVLLGGAVEKETRCAVRREDGDELGVELVVI